MKKTMVHVADYELYKILLPWKSLVSGVNSLILGELEKRHPRFSGNCCYDAKYSLEKKKLMAEVVVMEKASLARYKQTGGALYLETERKRSVFSQKARFVRVCTLVLLVLSGILSLRIAKSLFFAQSQSEPFVLSEPEKTELLSENETDGEENALLSGEELLKDIFSSVSRRGGKISAFSYAKSEKAGKIAGGVGGKCTFSVYGCNSEDVVNARYCVVSFKNNEPHFELELPFAEKSEEKSPVLSEEAAEDEKSRSQKIFSYEDELVAVASVRKRLRETGAVIESEHNGERTVEFVFSSSPSVLYSCLKICAESAEEFLWREEKISLSENGENCRVRLLLEKTERAFSESGEILSLCARYAYLFGSELNIQPKKANVFPSASSPAKALVVKEKIGEVHQSDGAVFICYRNIDGKMTFEKKELVNE